MEISSLLEQLEEVKAARLSKKAGTKVPTLKEIETARVEGTIETRKVETKPEPKPVVKESKATTVKVTTITKRLVNQLPYVWSPTRSFFSDGQVIGIINNYSGKVLDTGNRGSFLLVQCPSGNLVLAKIHGTVGYDEYKQIIVT